MLLRKELKAQNGTAKDQYKLFKDKKNNAIDKKEEDMSDNDKSDENKTVKNFDAILKDKKYWKDY